MLKQEIFNHYSSLLDGLMEDYNFFKLYMQSPHYNLQEMDDQLFFSDGEKVFLHAGVTRACLIDPSYDWVVKFDIYEDAFGSACEREIDIYDRACDASLEKYFSQIMYLGSYTRSYNFYCVGDILNSMPDLEDEDADSFEEKFCEKEREGEFGEMIPVTVNIPLYACRRGEYPKPRYSRDPEEEKELSCYTYSPLTQKNIGVAFSFFHEFGVDEFERLSDFLIENHVNDLHFGNVLEIDGHIALIDYAGFHDELDYEGDYDYEVFDERSSD